MITFSDLSQDSFSALQLVAQGDGSATTLKLNLSKPPFNLNFGGNLPASFLVDLFDADLGTASGAIATVAGTGDVLTLTFTQAPPADETIGPLISPFYASLSGGLKFGKIEIANFTKIQFQVLGNGSDTVLTVNLANPPFNLNFAGAIPAGFGVSVAGASASMSGDTLTVTLPSAPAAGALVELVLTPHYNSLP